MRSILLLLALLIVAPAPAMAVRKVEKKSKQQTGGSQTAEKSPEQRPQEGAVKGEQPGRERNLPEIKQPEKEDRFIDENSDGINDKIDQRQTVKVRKREKERENPPSQENRGRESKNVPEKKSRRDR